ncbi:MAG: hypothetical protein UHD05_07310, partial [Ruminococcus sp.]|nr:hypothetical protein [Ruminococcus sp.]
MKNKKSLFERFTTYFNPKNWQKKTKITTSVVAVILVIAVVLSFFVPTSQDFIANTSETMQEEIKKDETRINKQVLQSYNNLFIISYGSYATEGYYAEKEEFIGFAGQVFEAKDGFTGFVGEMVNYTYRLLG